MIQTMRTKVFVAVAAGAFIGSLIGLQLTPMFWWVGMLVGSMAGYLLYDPAAVIRAVPRAARAASDAMGGFLIELPEIFVAIVVGVASALGYVLMAIAAGITWGTLALLLIQQISAPINDPREYLAAWWIGFPGLSLVTGALLFFQHLLRHRGASFGESARRVFLQWNAIVVLLFYLPRWLIVKAIRLVPFLFLTGWHLFKLIHSDLRLLCGVDAAIGATIGIFAHNPLVGAIAGGLIGVLNFELISKRWLKLVPA